MLTTESPLCDSGRTAARRRKLTTQCDLSTATPLTLLPSAIKAPKAAPPPIQHADAPVGTRLEVFWRGKGKPDQWYVGTVTKIHTTGNGELRHDIVYDVDGGMYPRHDLANVWKWRRIDASAAASTATEANTS